MGVIPTRAGIALAAVAGLCALAIVPPEARSQETHPHRAHAEVERPISSSTRAEQISISANPAATNETTGTGWLGKQLGVDKSGIHLGGVWVGGINYQMSGGVDPGWTSLSALVVDLLVDLERFAGLKGASIGADFLQLNGQPTNIDAGSELGYIGLITAPPFDRSQLLELWWRQELFQEQLIIRIGKSNPAIDFQNVIRPVNDVRSPRVIDAVTSLLYGPIFVLPTNYEILPAFYETAYGVTSTWTPSEAFYVSYGFFDGNQAVGVDTGLSGPEFNGNYLHIAEMGFNWLMGAEGRPGLLSVGGWRHTGRLSTDDGAIEEDGAAGAYLVASQLLWFRDPEPTNDAGISGFLQLGWNDSRTLPFNYYLGAGLTGRALIRSRPKDSFGIGVAWGWLNSNDFDQETELMAQAYYQAHVAGAVYTETGLTYIPQPAAEQGLDAVWAISQQLIVPF